MRPVRHHCPSSESPQSVRQRPCRSRQRPLHVGVQQCTLHACVHPTTQVCEGGVLLPGWHGAQANPGSMQWLTVKPAYVRCFIACPLFPLKIAIGPSAPTVLTLISGPD